MKLRDINLRNKLSLERLRDMDQEKKVVLLGAAALVSTAVGLLVSKRFRSEFMDTARNIGGELAENLDPERLRKAAGMAVSGALGFIDKIMPDGKANGHVGAHTAEAAARREPSAPETALATPAHV